MKPSPLFDQQVRHPSEVADFLDERHYLGPTRRGWAWVSEEGVMVLGNPSSASLPQRRWLELLRWCLRPGENNGSRQWSRFARWAKRRLPNVTTVVSYSDPSVGHTGALYRACNWRWAPTWHRLRPPPTGNGRWTAEGDQQAVKDRWIYPLQPDPSREAILRVEDDALRGAMPWASYREPDGADYQRWIARRKHRGDAPCDQRGEGGSNPAPALRKDAS